VRDGVLDVESAAEGKVRPLTIIQGHSCRLIDEHADDRSGPLASTFDIDEVEREGSYNRSGNRTHRFRYLLGLPHPKSLDERVYSSNKKVGDRPL